MKGKSTRKTMPKAAPATAGNQAKMRQMAQLMQGKVSKAATGMRSRKRG